MASNKLIDIEINDENKIKIILLNIIKMLTNRSIFDDNKIEENHKILVDQINDNMVFKIYSNKIKKNIFIKFMYTKLTTIRKIPGVDEFFLAGKDGNKIVIVHDINMKTYKQFIEYPKTEVFWDEELMINLVDNNIIPKHIILTEEEKEEYIKSYQTKKKDMPRMFITDPISRYYNMTVGDIVRIERLSTASGININYRVVVPGPLSLFK